MEDNVVVVAQEIDTFQEEFQETAIACQQFCFITRAKEFQVQAREKLRDSLGKARKLKRKAIAAKYEDAANVMLSYEETVNALINELSMWIALKDDDAGLAWNCLVNAQMATLSAMKAHSLANHLESYSEHLALLEKHLFPPQMFFSPGMIIKEARCSICNAEYGECDHIVGKPYMGELCSRLILHVDVEEFSLVDKPANKHARVTSFTDGEGTHRDFLSWRVVSTLAAKTFQPEEGEKRLS